MKIGEKYTTKDNKSTVIVEDIEGDMVVYKYIKSTNAYILGRKDNCSISNLIYHTYLLKEEDQLEFEF